MQLAIAFVLTYTHYHLTFARGRVVTVGALFDYDSDDLEHVMSVAVNKISSEPWFGADLKMEWIGMNTSCCNSYEAAKTVCRMMKEDINVVIGPRSMQPASGVRSLCSWLNVPLIEMTEDFQTPKHLSGVNVRPQPRSLSKAFAAHIQQWDWYDEFAIIYENEHDLFRIQDMLQFSRMRSYLFSLEKKGDHRIMLKNIKLKGLTRFVLAVRTNLILDIFKMAEDVGMITEYYDYIIPNLDVHTINFEEFYNTRVNITTFQLVNAKQAELYDVFQQSIKTDVALLYDAVLIYAHVISELKHRGDIDYNTYKCEDEMATQPPHSTIGDKLKLISTSGITGPIKFNSDGQRTNFVLGINQMNYANKPEFRKIATWSEKTGYVALFTEAELEKERLSSDANLKVVTIANKPFLMEISQENRSEGGPKYEGFIVDLLDELANLGKFTYEIEEVADRRYGGMEANGYWYGMIGELVRKRADLAAADLAITQRREDVVDFTNPFLHVGITILMKKPAKTSTSFFDFLDPFYPDVWLWLLTAYLSVSVLMFLIARLSPFEWASPHPCNKTYSELKNEFSLANSLWFNIGSLMQQGCDLQPKAPSTRLIAGTWWFFILIMISSYTASLAAFLTAVQIGTTINSIEELARQNVVKYGLRKGGATHFFFAKHESEFYKKVWSVMESSEPTVFVGSNEEAVARVKLGNYAYFSESPFIEYITANDCDLRQVGGMLDSKGLGLAMPKNSPHWSKLNRGLMILQDSGIVQDLKRRWWLEEKLAYPCPLDEVSSAELGINNVGGVFIILFVGLVLACIIGAFEFAWSTRKKVVRKDLFASELKKELKFAANLCNSTKPAPQPKKDEAGEGIAEPHSALVRFRCTAV